MYQVSNMRGLFQGGDTMGGFIFSYIFETVFNVTIFLTVKLLARVEVIGGG